MDRSVSACVCTQLCMIFLPRYKPIYECMIFLPKRRSQYIYNTYIWQSLRKKNQSLNAWYSHASMVLPQWANRTPIQVCMVLLQGNKWTWNCIDTRSKPVNMPSVFLLQANIYSCSIWYSYGKWINNYKKILFPEQGDQNTRYSGRNPISAQFLKANLTY
jgi:hypothetical protein